MTVAELIAKLQACDPEAEVWHEEYPGVRPTTDVDTHPDGYVVLSSVPAEVEHPR